MPGLETSVRDQIALYVEGYITADELNDGLPDTWELDEEDDPGSTELVMLVLGYLAEYQNADRSESDLRRALAPHAGWSVQRTVTVTRLGSLDLQVRVGAGTGLQVVSVS